MFNDKMLLAGDERVFISQKRSAWSRTIKSLNVSCFPWQRVCIVDTRIRGRAEENARIRGRKQEEFSKPFKRVELPPFFLLNGVIYELWNVIRKEMSFKCKTRWKFEDFSAYVLLHASEWISSIRRCVVMKYYDEDNASVEKYFIFQFRLFIERNKEPGFDKTMVFCIITWGVFWGWMTLMREVI